jgi:hypothetical protein
MSANVLRGEPGLGSEVELTKTSTPTHFEEVATNI